MYEIKNLSYRYGDANSIEALKEINLKIDEYEFWAVAGPVGSGKTTLGLLLAGLINPTGGCVVFKGQEIGRQIKQHALWQKIGVLLQQPETQIFESSVFEEVSFALKNAGFSKEDIAKKTKKGLLMAGLDENYGPRSPFKLSGGEKRLVAIASVVAYEPQVLILDEPSAGLDSRGKKAVSDYLKQIKGKKTIVVITHDSDEILMADKVAVLDKGKLEATGKVKDILKEVFPKLGLSIPGKWSFLHSLTERGIDLNIDEDIAGLITDMEHRYGLS